MSKHRNRPFKKIGSLIVPAPKKIQHLPLNIKKTKAKKEVQYKKDYKKTIEVVCFFTTLICMLFLFTCAAAGELKGESKTLSPWVWLVGTLGILSGIGLVKYGEESGPINFVP